MVLIVSICIFSWNLKNGGISVTNLLEISIGMESKNYQDSVQQGSREQTEESGTTNTKLQ